MRRWRWKLRKGRDYKIRGNSQSTNHQDFHPSAQTIVPTRKEKGEYYIITFVLINPVPPKSPFSSTLNAELKSDSPKSKKKIQMKNAQLYYEL